MVSLSDNIQQLHQTEALEYFQLKSKIGIIDK